MEFDNDRLRKHTSKIEIFYWVLLIVVYPLINSISIFPKDIKMWPVLLLVNLLLFPAYFIYARLAGPAFFNKKWLKSVSLLSIFSFFVLHALTFVLHLLVLKFNLSATEQSYFAYNYLTVIRESVWIIINMSVAMAVYFVTRAIEEKESLLTVQKDNYFFKLRYLRTQLHPHFLFNTLNSIYSLSLQKSDRAPEVVVRLADLMRYLIYECNEEKIPLDKEIDFIRNYIEIEKVRFKADIVFSVDGNTSGIMIEPMLFISFVENAFKHAMDNSFSEPFIYITLKVSSQQIILNVINSCDADLGEQAKRINGKGISSSKQLLQLLYPGTHALEIIQTDVEESRQSKLRLRNARERLETLYPDAYTLDVILNKRTFTVSLIIQSKAA